MTRISEKFGKSDGHKIDISKSIVFLQAKTIRKWNLKGIMCDSIFLGSTYRPVCGKI